MEITTGRATTVFGVLILLIAGVAGALAAAPSVDSETTNTATTSELTAGGTQTYNATTTTYLNWSADSPNSSVTITQNGETLFTATPTAGSSVDTGTDGNPDLWYYNVSLADDGSDYDGLEAAINSDATLNVTLTNNTEASNPDTTNFTFTFSNGEEKAFIAGTSADTELEAEDDSAVSSLAFWANDSDAGAAKITDETTINNNTSEIVVAIESSDAVDSFAAAAEGTDGLTLVSYAMVDDRLVPVFVGSSDASWLDDDEAYVLLSESGEQATIHNAGSLVDSKQSVDVEMTGNEALGWQSVSMLRDYGAGWTTAVSQGNIVDANGNPEWEAAA